MKCILKATLALPPYFGGVGDVVEIQDAIAQMLIEHGTVESLEVYERKKAAEKKAAEAPAESGDIQISGSQAEDARVEQMVSEIDGLFEKQHGEVAEVSEAEPVTEQSAEAPAGRRKGK